MKEKITDMLKLQDKLNAATCGDNYRSGKTNQGKVIDYARCIYQEACELENSFAWKHWKDTSQQSDLSNAKIELIDIWHFIMSLALMQNELSELSLKIDKLASQTNEETLLSLAKNLIHESSAALPSCAKLCEIFSSLCEQIGLSLDELYEIYIGKNILNVFRQEHGYKDGSYKKFWNGKEDNVIMSELLKQGGSCDELYENLERIYKGLK